MTKTYREFVGMVSESFSESDTMWHGTSNVEAARSILSSGMVDSTKHDRGAALNNLTPMAGRTYFTKDISYAMIYAIGGDLAGSDYHKDSTEYGYLFEVSAAPEGSLVDEDDLGEMVYNVIVHKQEYYLEDEEYDEVRQVVVDNIDHYYIDDEEPEDDLYMSPYDMFEAGQYELYAVVGKLLHDKLDPVILQKLTDQGKHFSSDSPLHVKSAWKIPLNKVGELKRDASNLFDHAIKLS